MFTGGIGSFGFEAFYAPFGAGDHQKGSVSTCQNFLRQQVGLFEVKACPLPQCFRQSVVIFQTEVRNQFLTTQIPERILKLH